MSVLAAIPPALTLCASAPHRAVLGLLAVAMGRPAYAQLIQDLHRSKPEQIAAIANKSYGQTILASAFRVIPELEAAIPRDLAIYFTEMQRANGVRNAQAIAQLKEITAILAPHDIPILALKGAADILCPIHDIPAHRYISDLDLLVPRHQITHAARLLREAKGLPVTDQDILPGTHHHLTQIAASDWLFTIELHIQPGSEIVQSALNATEMMANANPSTISGLSVPSAQDRFIHNILHNMELRHETAALHLRTLADHARYLTMLTPSEVRQAQIRLRTAGLGAWQADLTAATDTLNGIPPRADEWAGRALVAFGTPKTTRSRDTMFWMKRYAQRFVRNSAYRRQLIRKLLSQKAWTEFIQFHRDRRNRFK